MAQSSTQCVRHIYASPVKLRKKISRGAKNVMVVQKALLTRVGFEPTHISVVEARQHLT
jgi:hypothetical protein